MINYKTFPLSEFIACRKLGVGASEIGILLGVNQYRTPFQLWEIKTGKSKEQAETPPMRRGKALEPIVAQMWQEETGLIAKPNDKIYYLENEHLVATPDFDIDGTRWLEAKTSATFVIRQWEQMIPLSYYLQLLQQLLCSGRESGEIAVLDVLSWELRRLPFGRDEKLIEKIRNIAGAWYEKYVLKDTPPPLEVPDYKLLTHVSGKRVVVTVDGYKDLTKYRELDGKIKIMEAELDSVKDRIIGEIGDAESLVYDGKVLATYKSQKRHDLDKDRLKKEYPEIFDLIQKESQFRRLTVKKE